jgi:hypothetical protein
MTCTVCAQSLEINSWRLWLHLHLGIDRRVYAAWKGMNECTKLIDGHNIPF